MTSRRYLRRALGLAALTLSSVAVAQGANPPLQPGFIDPSVSPCVDFYAYSNGTWQKTGKIPASRSSSGVNLEVDDQIRSDVAAVLKDASARTDWPAGSLEQKVGDLYASALDTKAIEKAGTAPLKPLLAKVARLKSTKRLGAVLADLNRSGVSGAFGLSVFPDLRIANVPTLFMDTAGLTLPDRGLYLDNDKGSKAIRAGYAAYLQRVFRLIGDDAATARSEAEAVVAIETRLARATYTVDKNGQIDLYRNVTRARLAQLAPRLGVKSYLAGMGVPKATNRFSINNPGFFKELDASLNFPAATWRSYLRARVVTSTSDLLDKRFRRAGFEFFGRTLEGLQAPESRVDVAGAAVDGTLPDALGQLYVNRVFSPEAKTQVLALTTAIVGALRTDLAEITWMSPTAKAEAYRKLDTLHVKIGYPDVWRDYAGLRVARGDYAGNILRARRAESRRLIGKLSAPLDRNEWGLSAPTNNAYYDPQNNDIVFPAGILQPPFFDPAADLATNYGSIGATIGHELTHGFDDSGRTFNADGLLRNWWTPTDDRNYKERTNKLVTQFSAFQPLPGLRINGSQTLGENIADLGGLKIAYRAWKAVQPAAPPPTDGLTAEKRFFIAYAQSWRTRERKEALKLQLTTDVHSPAKFRVNGPIADLPEFTTAFACKPGDPMVTAFDKRPEIW